ncbi:hypothetical protein Tco_1067140 [Tanacetum coccineum]|uniref:Nucleotide-diphospho-sugar transferase domain-containing protein n=1 Tax=Tanacetum coccineum TaxID=301880 RepID=A0ABQ5HCB4_9ASTR
MEDDDPDDIADIFKIEGNLFNFKTPLCKAFNEFNYLLKIDTDLFAFDIAKIKTYEEYELNNNMTEDLDLDIDGFCNGGELPGMVRVGCMTYFQDHKWYDELTDGKLKEEALMHKAEFEESWGLQLSENYGANNAGNTQDSQEYKKEHHDSSNCNIRIFEMIKYAFDADDEYVAIKEHEHLDHSRNNIDACQAY